MTEHQRPVQLPMPVVAGMLRGLSATWAGASGHPGVLWSARVFPLDVASKELRRLVGPWRLMDAPSALSQRVDGDSTVGTIEAMWAEHDNPIWMCLGGVLFDDELHVVRRLAEQGCVVAVNVDLVAAPPHPGPDGVVTFAGGRIHSAQLSLLPPWEGMTFDLIEHAQWMQ